ncbi:uncharacterized protein LOC116831271 isoform X2 [Chelonoidis abingdonii]|uniref:uncharacterized protein LOC116831271 isoform X2 n=1 Tax=Chelonoidis abingdonii TaxID=106734 RepID=UPI003F494EFA
MGSSSSKNCCSFEKIRRMTSTISFLLKATFNSFEFFEDVSKENLQLGDIILFPIRTSPKFSSWKHAGVYYGNKKVIHFNREGISIQGIDAMEGPREKHQILRLKQGINEEAFLKKADAMLKAKTTYDCFTNNCIHFALFLLDMEEFYHEIVSDVEVDNGNDAGEEEFFCKLAHEEFGVLGSYPSSWKHTGVYYGSKKVNHFNGQVYIQGIDAMERIKGKYQILRLKQGINEEAFLKKADAMLNAKTTYNCFTNNCIHFALFLLDMEEFYHEIVPLNMTGQVDQNECNRARQFQNNMSQREIPLRHFP